MSVFPIYGEENIACGMEGSLVNECSDCGISKGIVDRENQNVPGVFSFAAAPLVRGQSSQIKPAGGDGHGDCRESVTYWSYGETVPPATALRRRVAALWEQARNKPMINRLCMSNAFWRNRSCRALANLS